MKEVKRIELSNEIIDMIQALYEDYRAKQDLLTMIFEIHKDDDNASIIESKPFESYEMKFRKAKVAYDAMMKEIQQTCIPEEYKDSHYSFEVDFENRSLIIKENV